MPLFSIITVNRNNAQGLERTIQSVIEQTYQDYEFIIIDGASTDESINIIKQYEQHIAFFVSEPDRGVYDAMNKGILQAKGEFLVFMNSGDSFVDANVLFDVAQERDLHKNIIVLGETLIQYDNQYLLHQKIHITKFDLPVAHQSIFFKNQLFKIVGLYDLEYRLAGDFDIWQKGVLRFPYQIKSLNRVIASYEGGGVSTQLWKEVYKEYWKASQKNLPFYLFCIFAIIFSLKVFKTHIRFLTKQYPFLEDILMKYRAIISSKTFFLSSQKKDILK